jgi:uncharacterized protein (TIGR02271 family)
MDLKGRLRQGLRIFGDGDRDYGAVERYDDQYVYVGGRRIPHDAFERLDDDRLYVGRSGARYFAQDASAATGSVAAEGEIRVPVVEERLQVGKQAVELGEVQVHKTVETEQVNVPVELAREEVHVERVDVADRPVAAGEVADAFKEGTIRVPVRGEEAVVAKQAVVTGEVVIDRYRTVEQRTVSDTVRREHVEVDEHYLRNRDAFREHYAANRGRSGKPPFDEAEGTYRTGFLAGSDERYRHKTFDDAEPELRQEWQASGARGGAGWEQLREEIREGWNRSRGR